LLGVPFFFLVEVALPLEGPACSEDLSREEAGLVFSAVRAECFTVFFSFFSGAASSLLKSRGGYWNQL